MRSTLRIAGVRRGSRGRPGLGAGALAALVGGLGGCKVKKADPPALSGPSELGLSITVEASPDVLTRDGFSQSRIVVIARDANANPVSSLSVRLEITVSGVVVDFGQLSTRTVVTGTDGRAVATYTSPLPPPESVDTFTIVTILATPIGTNFANAVARAVDIRLVPPGVILPPNGTPVADFIFSPRTPEENAPVRFDAGPSVDDGTIVSYAWDFGDGSAGSGLVTTHTYSVRGTYTVTLTVTDDRGLSDSATQFVAVSATENPSAVFTVSPTSPKLDEPVFVNAAGSTAAPGRTIVSHAWTFGDGGLGSGVTTTHRHTELGSFAITLTVTDDVSKTGTSSKTVFVGAQPTPTAAFTFSPTSPSVDSVVQFDASLSTASPDRTIVSYRWAFGDGGTGSGRVDTHTYSTAGTYTVVLTVTDNIGITDTATQTITVGGKSSPTASFTISPSSLPSGGGTIVADATASTAPPGATIVRYEWNFGDSTIVDVVSTPVHTHVYTADGTFTITLTVTDSAGRKQTTTGTITVGSGSPTASFTISPTGLPAGAAGTVIVDASASKAPTGTTIVSYMWNFGDSTTVETVSAPTHSHLYAMQTAGTTFVITLTITDSAGGTGTTSSTITFTP